VLEQMPPAPGAGSASAGNPNSTVSPGSAARAVAPRSFELNRSGLSTNSTLVLSGLLPPGRYIITHMVGRLANVTYTFPLGGQLPPFEVKARAATLLGTIMVQPGAGNQFQLGYVAPDREFQETFEQLFPALAAQVRDSTPLSFDRTELLARRAALAPGFRLRFSALNGLTQSADGTLYAGTRTGIGLMRRPNDQRWRAIDVGSWREIMAVRPYRDGLLVAGEEGLLKYSSDEGRRWTALKSPDNGLIYGLEPLPGGLVLAVTRYKGLWTVYRSANVLDGVWQKLAEFEGERSINVTWASPRMVASGNRIGIMMPNGTYHLIDGQSGTVEKFPGALSVLSLSAMPDGRLVQRGTALTSKTITSEDFGRTWSDVNIGRFAGSVVFKDRNTLYAVAPLDPGVTAGAFGFMVSRDGGQNWTQSGVTPGGMPQAVQELMIDRVDGSVLAVLSNTSVLRSRDEGKTWSAE
jgi:hypothetical protein